MLMLKLDDDRTMIPTRDKDGNMVTLSPSTCSFIMSFCLFSMSDAERKACLRPKTFTFTEDQKEEI